MQQRRWIARHTFWYSVVSFAAVGIGLLVCAGGAASQTFEMVHTFCQTGSCPDGRSPQGDLIEDAAGDLYGTTYYGGTNDFGTVFELIPQKDGSWKQRVLHSMAFCDENGCPDGEYPEGNLVLDTSGNLYGTNGQGGPFLGAGGTVFELTPNQDRTKWKFRVLYTFGSKANHEDGDFLSSGLSYAGQSSGQLYDGVSPLFGIASEGGTYGEGSAYELKPRPGKKNWQETTLYSFCRKSNCTDGQNPYGNILVASTGVLYGTTDFGGRIVGSLGGTVFELTPQETRKGWRETVLHSFCTESGCADGANPVSGVVDDGNGDLFGTTSYGGAGGGLGFGVIFEITPQGDERVLYTFCSEQNCSDGSIGWAGLAVDSAGNLFGVTGFGGAAGKGVVFELGTSYQVLYSLCSQNSCSDGEEPMAGLLLDSSGNLFGTASAGGTEWMGGTVFELTK